MKKKWQILRNGSISPGYSPFLSFFFVSLLTVHKTSQLFFLMKTWLHRVSLITLQKRDRTLCLAQPVQNRNKVTFVDCFLCLSKDFEATGKVWHSDRTAKFHIHLSWQWGGIYGTPRICRITTQHYAQVRAIHNSERYYVGGKFLNVIFSRQGIKHECVLYNKWHSRKNSAFSAKKKKMQLSTKEPISLL